MAAELVDAATSERMADMDWEKNIKICELVAHDKRQAKDVIKQIKKRLGSKNTSRQLFAVMLLEMLMNNIGEHIHRQVIEAGLLPLLAKIVKKKSDLPIRERIFLLLDATQTSLGGASGMFPQYYNTYSDLVSAGVQFSQVPETVRSNQSFSKGNDDDSTGASFKSDNITSAELVSSMHQSGPLEETNQDVAESSIIQKACNALEVLREVIDATDAQKNYESAKDDFTLDLVEQCSLQKQRVMQLVLTSKDENVVSQAIEVNEDLQKVISRHYALISVSPASNSNTSNHEETEEEEVEQLFRRKQKGKACIVAENEAPSSSPGPADRSHRPHIRPLCIDSETAPTIPPPPSKHAERERFFQDKKVDPIKSRQSGNFE